MPAASLRGQGSARSDATKNRNREVFTSRIWHAKWLFPQPVQVEKSVGDKKLMHVVDDDKFEEQSADWGNGAIQIYKSQPFS